MAGEIGYFLFILKQFSFHLILMEIKDFPIDVHFPLGYNNFIKI